MEHAGKNLMNSFEDCIGLGIAYSCNVAIDSITFKEFLKLEANKFGSIVMDTFEWSWIAWEPLLVEGKGNHFRFFVRNSNDFNPQ